MGGWLRPRFLWRQQDSGCCRRGFRSRWAGSWGQGAHMGEGQPTAPRLTPHRPLCAHDAPFPANPQTDFLCYLRLLSPPLWALRRVPPQGLGSLRDFQLGKGQGRRGGLGKRDHLMVGPWAGGQSVRECAMCARPHALLGKCDRKEDGSGSCAKQILQPYIWVRLP